LIEEKGFNCIAVEGDWPDAFRVNRFIKGYETSEKNAIEVLKNFTRWPTWMWANWEMVALVNWMKEHNRSKPLNRKVGFYGLDVYSLWESMQSIMDYLEKTDPAAMRLAEEAFHCFEPYRKGEGISYGRASRFVPELCQSEVKDLLLNIRQKITSYNTDPENVFSVEQNARIAVNAEEYYRIMLEGGPHSWNLRDKHMADTLERLLEFHGPDSRIIVWAHNTHIGDARATDMVDEGMFNLGEIARIRHQQEGVVLVGFGSYQGSVIAGRSWGSEMHRIPLPPARENSWEYYLHLAGEGNKLILTEDLLNNYVMMEKHYGHRAVGVVYDPRFEEYGNYVPTIIPLRYDAFIYLNETKALFPLHIKPHGNEMPETYPFGV
ncbi:MAG TPA: erythromycin esterase family protein, partial [Chitinophagaceae bacterium]|nr:erythromycin esterase family protein [Chitinophagaceae bacterium]